MVRISESKYDKYGRITCSVKIAELLELEKGEDTIEWFVEGGEVILRKRTKVYHGHNFEQEEIMQRLLDFEEDMVLNGEDLDMDPEEVERIAREEYEKDKALRKKSMGG